MQPPTMNCMVKEMGNKGDVSGGQEALRPLGSPDPVRPGAIDGEEKGEWGQGGCLRRPEGASPLWTPRPGTTGSG